MRPFHRLYALVFRYFWRDCLRCGRGFGGHQWRSSAQTIPTDRPGTSQCVYCPRCAPPPTDDIDVTYLTRS